MEKEKMIKKLLDEVYEKTNIRHDESINSKAETLLHEIKKKYNSHPTKGTLNNLIKKCTASDDTLGYLAGFVLDKDVKNVMKEDTVELKGFWREYAMKCLQPPNTQEEPNPIKLAEKEPPVNSEILSLPPRTPLPPKPWNWLRKVMLGILLLLVGVIIGCIIKSAHGKTTWKMKTAWSDNASFPGKVVLDFVNDVNDELKGELEIIIVPHSLYGEGKSIEPKILLAELKEGKINILHGSPYYFKEDNPKAILFSSVPFGKKIKDELKWIYDNRAALTQLFKSDNIITYFGGITSEQNAGWYQEEPTRIDFFRGKKVRFGGFPNEILAEVRAEVKSIYQDDILRAMQNGEIQVAEWMGECQDIELGLNTLNTFKYYDTSHWHEPSSAFAFLVNEKSLKALNKTTRNKLEDIIAKHFPLIKDPQPPFSDDIYKEYVKSCNAIDENVIKFELNDTIQMELKKITLQLLQEKFSGDDTLFLSKYLENTELKN